MFESDEEDRRRDAGGGGGGRFPRERAGGDRTFTSYDRNGGHAPPDPSDRLVLCLSDHL